MTKQAEHRQSTGFPQHPRHQKRIKSDFHDWLLRGYTLRQDFQGGHSNGAKMVDSERDSKGNFVNLDGQGRPSDQATIDRIVERITCGQVDEAIELLGNSRQLRGGELIESLKYKLYANAPRPEVDDATIWRRYWTAIEHIENMVYLRAVG